MNLINNLYIRRDDLGNKLALSSLQLSFDEVSRFLAVGEKLVGRGLNSAEIEDVVAFDFGESGSALVQNGVENAIDSGDVDRGVGLCVMSECHC